MVNLLDRLIGWYIPDDTAFKHVYITGFRFLVFVVVVTLVANILGAGSSFFISIFGVKTEVSYLTSVLVVLVWIDANMYIRRHQKGENRWSYTYTAFLVAIMLLISVVLHELGHALMSYAFHNPIEAAGLGFVGAFVQPAKNLFSESPIEQILVSAAGPGTDYILFLLATWYVAKNKESLAENAVQYFAWVNYILIVYNLIPFVLNTDGSKVLHGFLRLIGVSTIWLEPITFVSGVILCLFYYLYRVATNQKSMHEKLASM